MRNGDKKERQAIKDSLRLAIGDAIEHNVTDMNKVVTLKDLIEIEAVMEKEGEVIEDQEERIAIMMEGKE